MRRLRLTIRVLLFYLRALRHRVRQAPRDGQLHRFYRQFLASGDLCFDVGASTGDRTRVFARLGCHTVAVEPQPECAELIRRAGTAAAVVEAAVGSEEGIVGLTLAEPPVLATVSPDWIADTKERFRVQWGATIQVRMTTLDELIREYGEPAFCKIDVEGSELAVLNGLGRPLRGLSFEFVRERLAVTRACVERLQALGFTVFDYTVGESLELSGAWVSGERVLEALADLPGGAWGDVYASSLHH